MLDRTRACLLLLAFLSMACWGRVVVQPSSFFFDDEVFAVNNTATWSKAFTQDSYSAAGYQGAPPVVYRPVGVMVLASERSLFGVEGTRPWHLLSLLAHASAACLLFLWLMQLGLSQPRALLAASIWAATPLHAEALGWVAGQFDVFSAVLLLVSLLLVGRGSPIALAGSGLAFVLAVAVKETMVAGAPALVTAAWVTARRREPGAPMAAAFRHAAMAGGIALLLVGSLANLRSAAGVVSALPPDASLPALLASQGGAFLRAMGLSDIVTVSGPPLHPPSLSEFLGALGVLAILGRSLFMRPGPAMAAGALLLLTVPSLLFGQLGHTSQVDPDRYFYLASAAFPALVLLGWPQGRPRRAVVGVIAGVLVVSWLTLRSIPEAGYWADFESSIERHLELGRSSDYLHYLLGEERLRLARPCEALPEFNRCLELVEREGRRQQCASMAELAAAQCRGAVGGAN